MKKVPDVGAVVPWFGTNRGNPSIPGEQFRARKVKHITVTCGGGLCELPYMPDVQMYVCDLHDDLINLATVVADPVKRIQVSALLEPRLFHPKTYEDAARRLRDARMASSGGGIFGAAPDPDYTDVMRAADFFTVAWLGRSSAPGTKNELNGEIALRGDGGGGDHVVRFRSAQDSLVDWHGCLKWCQFARESMWDTIPRVRARALSMIEVAKKKEEEADPALAIYCDPPWPDDGDVYLYPFTYADQRRLAREVSDMPPGVTMVMRFGDHALIRELYPEARWEWLTTKGRTQTNEEKAEVFLVSR